MSREIKFRAWDVFQERMHYGAESGIYEDPDEIIPFDKILGFPCYEVMEYTGVKDYENKEIYEDDIVQFFNDEDYILKPGKAAICFDLGAFCIKHFKYGTETLGNMDIDDMFIKVIGNIHENPELLESEEQQ